jgi:WD40 repeat protein
MPIPTIETFRILDCPELQSDFFRSPISWSSNDVLGVALDQEVLLYDMNSSEVTMTYALEEVICSVEFAPRATQVAVGTDGGHILIFDVNTNALVRDMAGHHGRVSSLAWTSNQMLTSGSQDTTIANHDIRVPDHRTSTYAFHTREVCGLKPNPEGTCLASGSHDHIVCVWDARAASLAKQQPSLNTNNSTNAPLFTMTQHEAAVKALAWSPHQQGLLASGGAGTDCSIKFSNTLTSTVLNSIDTGSPISSLLWNPFQDEILSCHGGNSNALYLWDCATMAQVKECTEHNGRVLQAVVGPRGQVASVGADETLRFWDVFGSSSASSDLDEEAEGGGEDSEDHGCSDEAEGENEDGGEHGCSEEEEREHENGEGHECSPSVLGGDGGGAHGGGGEPVEEVAVRCGWTGGAAAASQQEHLDVLKGSAAKRPRTPAPTEGGAGTTDPRSPEESSASPKRLRV